MTPSAQARPVRLLAAGGTISMQGEHAVPALDAAALVQAVPELARFPRLRAENVLGLPGPQIALPEALDLARHAARAAAGGEGVVITTGTDTMEELAVLCALQHTAAAPIVLTGANRTASAPGADGPANLLDAITLAAAPRGEGLGAVVVFGGEIHAATSVRKVDSTGPAAFGSPVAGPVGRVFEGRVWLHARPVRPTQITPERLEHRVPILLAALGEDGTLMRTAAQTADGLVVVAFGAGHLTPGMLHALADAIERIPVVLTCRPERGSMLHATYGFEGSERDLRATGAICAPFLSPVAARIALLCCLGAGLDRDATAAAFAPWDA
ncbi:MAG TPA: asparaginase [Solirubrobacteraceae bacterium]|nr:asparaginase [Solirubrobacteraceae bacterium]